MEKIITIFNEDLTIKAFVGSSLALEFIGEPDPYISDMLKEIAAHPKIRKEVLTAVGSSVSYEELTKDDPRYFDALTQGLLSQLIIAVLVPKQMKNMLLNLSRSDISQIDREKLVSSLANFTEENTKELLTDLEKLKELTLNTNESK